jgi:exonuclease SbcC
VIPLHLKLSGFLSYRDTVELDFRGFDLACISGSNGAGKSSLLDAMTWALFGQARKRDEAVINLQSRAAEVAFTFAYESNVYRVIRSLARGKNTLLEFQISDNGGSTPDRIQLSNGPSSIVNDPYTWRALTERTLRETQARIEQILRLDYETFVNVSFFLQGRADQFAQQPPTRRKEILGAILGLETWEVYRERAAGRRKEVEGQLNSVDGRVAEIEAELGEEESRKQHLAGLESQLGGVTASRKLQQAVLEDVRQMHLNLEKRREDVRKIGADVEQAQQKLAEIQARLSSKQTERGAHAELVGRAGEIEAAYAALGKARLDLEKWEQTAGRFHEHDQRRQPLLREIEAECARLEQEKDGLEAQGRQVADQLALTDGYRVEVVVARQMLVQSDIRVAERHRLEKLTQSGREKLAELRTANATLRTQMTELDERIKKLAAAEGAVCPLCGQSLSPEHRQSTLEQLQAEGKAKGDLWRANKSTLDELSLQISQDEERIRIFTSAEDERLKASTTISQLTERLESLQKQSDEWEQVGAQRLEAVTHSLEKGKFAAEARRKLASLDKELARLGYDSAAHDAARQAELQARPAEDEYRALASARAALKPLDDEIANLADNIASGQISLDAKQVAYAQAQSTLSVSESQAPDLQSAERTYLDLQERENQLHQEVGAARQKVTVLDDLRRRKKTLEAEHAELGLQIGRYKTLERAFGKDGVPALLIEQALPQIEMKANEILGRLSDDSMRLHFETQARYKDEKRRDLRETLEIQVSDGAGLRDYELYSGGEAFRVNFAIRLALSEVLAQRKGARLRMLVIDEGFGSQDALGRQRLIQAINAVKGDFATILVITHLEELKDAFPARIEVEKIEGSSTLTVI